MNGLYEPALKVPLTVRLFAARPENPDKAPVVPNVNIPVLPPIVNVPLPDSVPFNVSALVPLPTVGPAPRGIEQLLLTVLVPAEWVKLTRLKVTLLQLSVAVVVPLKLTVPPLAVKVGVPEMVIAPLIEVVPLEAVKLPPDSVKAAMVSVWPAAEKLLRVPVCEKVVVTVRERARVIVPV